jgi:hypothetical protein
MIPMEADLKLTAEQAKALVDERRAVLLDTRSPDDFARSDKRLPGSVRVTPEQVMSGGAWRPGMAVVAYCT